MRDVKDIGNQMKLSSRTVHLVDDFTPATNFPRGCQRWHPPPAYWNTGKSPIAVYLTMFEGHETNHQVWEDEGGQIQAYSYLSPGEKTPIYSTPEVREWRVLVHPEQRTEQVMRRLIQDAEARLNQRTSTHPITTPAYEKDHRWTDLLIRHGYIRRSELTTPLVSR